jgi:hypothetical protein
MAVASIAISGIRYGSVGDLTASSLENKSSREKKDHERVATTTPSPIPVNASQPATEWNPPSARFLRP